MFMKSWLNDPGVRQYIAACCWNLGGMNLGVFLGWSAVTTPMLQDKYSPVLGQTPISDEDISYSTSLPFIGGICCSFIWGYVANILGRKMAGYMTAICYIVCYSIIMKTDSVNMFIFGRVIGGAAYCAVLFNGPMYIAEMAETSKIGRLSSTYLIIENIGTLLTYIVGSLFSFKIVNMFSLLVAVLFLVVLTFFPESPVFYLKNDRLTEARLSLQWYRPPADEIYLDNEIKRLNETFILAKTIKFKYLFTRHTLVGIMIALYLQWGIQTTGINYLTGYQVTIFQQSANIFNPYVCTVITGIVNVIAPSLYFLITNKLGRKVILVISYSLQSINFGFLGFYYFYIEHNPVGANSILNVIPLLCLSLYFLTYSSGAGPVPFTVYSEIFSSEVRNTVVPFIYIWNGLTSFLVMRFVPTVLYQTVHMSGVIWFFSASTFLTAIFVLIFVPETKDKPFLKVIEELTNTACW